MYHHVVSSRKIHIHGHTSLPRDSHYAVCVSRGWRSSGFSLPGEKTGLADRTALKQHIAKEPARLIRQRPPIVMAERYTSDAAASLLIGKRVQPQATCRSTSGVLTTSWSSSKKRIRRSSFSPLPLLSLLAWHGSRGIVEAARSTIALAVFAHAVRKSVGHTWPWFRAP